MGRRQNRKKTRKTKMTTNKKQQSAEYRECIPEINLTPADYNSMSEIGRAALDNVIALTGRSKEEILLQNI